MNVVVGPDLSLFFSGSFLLRRRHSLHCTGAEETKMVMYSEEEDDEPKHIKENRFAVFEFIIIYWIGIFILDSSFPPPPPLFSLANNNFVFKMLFRAR